MASMAVSAISGRVWSNTCTEFVAYHLLLDPLCCRLLQNPDNSPLLKQTLFSLTHDDQGNFSLDAMKQVLDDSSAMTGLPRHTIAMDALRYEGGRTFAWRTLCECFQQILAHFREWFFGLLGKSKISDSDKYAGSQVVKLA